VKIDVGIDGCNPIKWFALSKAEKNNVGDEKTRKSKKIWVPVSPSWGNLRQVMISTTDGKNNESCLPRSSQQKKGGLRKTIEKIKTREKGPKGGEKSGGSPTNSFFNWTYRNGKKK